MPKATIDVNEVTFDLKSIPTGFVKLKRMTYGDWLARRDMSMQMSITAVKGSTTADPQFELQNKKVTLFEFSKCVIDHNLEDENEKKLDFTRADILDVLDPRIGNEIGELIASMHDFDEALKN